MHTTVLQDPWLVESMGAEPGIWRANFKVAGEFLTVQRVGAPNLPKLFKGPLYSLN